MASASQEAADVAMEPEFVPAAGLASVYRGAEQFTTEDTRLELCRVVSGLVKQDLEEKIQRLHAAMAHAAWVRAEAVYVMVCGAVYEREIWQTLDIRASQHIVPGEILILDMIMLRTSVELLGEDTFGVSLFSVHDGAEFQIKSLEDQKKTMLWVKEGIQTLHEGPDQPGQPFTESPSWRRYKLRANIEESTTVEEVHPVFHDSVFRKVPLHRVGRYYKFPEYADGEQYLGFTPASTDRVVGILDNMVRNIDRCLVFLREPRDVLPSCVSVFLDGYEAGHAVCALRTGASHFSIIDSNIQTAKESKIAEKWSRRGWLWGRRAKTFPFPPQLLSTITASYDTHFPQTQIPPQDEIIFAYMGRGDCLAQAYRTILLGSAFKRPDGTIDVQSLAELLAPSEYTITRLEQIQRFTVGEDGRAIPAERRAERVELLTEYHHVLSQMVVSTAVQEFMARMCENDSRPLEFYEKTAVLSKFTYESEVDTHPPHHPSRHRRYDPYCPEAPQGFRTTRMAPWKIILPYLKRIKGDRYTLRDYILRRREAARRRAARREMGTSPADRAGADLALRF
jgi:hypothetical protein